MKKHLILTTVVFLISLASCEKEPINKDTPSPIDEDIEQLDFSKVALIGDLGLWRSEVELRIRDFCSIVDNNCDLIFTDVNQLISQAEAIFDAFDNGAVVVVVNPDFKKMATSLEKYLDEMGISEDEVSEALLFAFSERESYEVNEPILFQTEERDDLGNIIQPAKQSKVEDINYRIEFNPLAEWLSEYKQEQVTKANDKKQFEIPSSAKQTMNGSQTICYKFRVKKIVGYDDWVWTKGYVQFEYNYLITPMFGVQRDECFDYYYVVANFRNTFGKTVSELNKNLPKSFSAEELTNDYLNITYNDYKGELDKQYYGGLIHNYVFQVYRSWIDLHICGPMQKYFRFNSAIETDESDKGKYSISFAIGGQPIPKTDVGMTKYQHTQTYTFGKELSIGLYGYGEGGKDNGESCSSLGAGIDIGAAFDWTNTDTRTYSYDLSDREIGLIGGVGEAGWCQTFNNLPNAKGANGFDLAEIKNVAISNGEQECSWVWQVGGTQKGSTESIGCIKTTMELSLRTVCNGRTCSVEDVTRPFSVTMKSARGLLPTRRVANGQVIIQNSLVKYATNINFKSTEPNGKSYRVNLQGSSSQYATVASGKKIYVLIPEGSYTVQYDLYNPGSSVTETKNLYGVRITNGEETIICVE